MTVTFQKKLAPGRVEKFSRAYRRNAFYLLQDPVCRHELGAVKLNLDDKGPIVSLERDIHRNDRRARYETEHAFKDQRAVQGADLQP